MTLPLHIQVGPHRYRVTTEEAERTRSASLENRDCHEFDLAGSTNYRHGLIHIGLNNPRESEPWSPDYIADTLLHEVLHCIWHSTCSHVPALAEHQEQAICLLSPLLLDTLRRNPELVAALVGGKEQP